MPRPRISQRNLQPMQRPHKQRSEHRHPHHPPLTQQVVPRCQRRGNPHPRGSPQMTPRLARLSHRHLEREVRLHQRPASLPGRQAAATFTPTLNGLAPDRPHPSPAPLLPTTGLNTSIRSTKLG
jgi:hypothetical protein